MNLKSRKLIISVVLFVTSIVFVAIDQATFKEFAEFIKWIFMTYIVGNVGEHVATRMKS